MAEFLSQLTQLILRADPASFPLANLERSEPFIHLPFYLNELAGTTLSYIYGDNPGLNEAMNWRDALADRIRRYILDGLPIDQSITAGIVKLSQELVRPASTWRQILIVSGISFVGEPFQLLRGTFVYPASSLDDADTMLAGQHIVGGEILKGRSNDNWVALVSEGIVPKLALSTSPVTEVGLGYHERESLITAIRLTKSHFSTIAGEILIDLADFPSRPPSVYSGRLGTSGISLQMPPLVEPTSFTSEEFNESVNIYRRLTARGSAVRSFEVLPDPFSQAVDRFNQSFESRGVWEDVTNLTIALEALLGVGQEISYRLSARCASLLACPFSEVEEVHALVRAMYEIRSAVAHGAPKRFSKPLAMLSGIPKKTPSMIIKGQADDSRSQLTIPAEYERWRRGLIRAQNLVRLALLACLTLASNSHQSHRWPFGDSLDSELLSPAKRDAWRAAAGIIESDMGRHSLLKTASMPD